MTALAIAAAVAARWQERDNGREPARGHRDPARAQVILVILGIVVMLMVGSCAAVARNNRRSGAGLSDAVPQREVLTLLAAGRSDGGIGDALFISRKTASVHVANIKATLGAASRVEIVVHAFGLGLVDAPARPEPS